MELPNRNAQTAAPGHTPVAATGGGKRGRDSEGQKLSRIGFLAAIVAVAILLIAVLIVVAGGSNNKQEDKLVDSSRLQAVFLNTGQVYFGNIKDLNTNYFVLTNIYYLQTSNGSTTAATTSSNTSVSLVKLGCELHEPYDKMVINRSQVTFWENLQDGGQVAKAVSTFEKQNPNGQKCADQSSSAGTDSVNSTQNAGSSSTSTTPSTTNTTKP